MALQFRCQKHDRSYIAPDIRRGKGPLCPECREEWEQQRALEKARSPGGYKVDLPQASIDAILERYGDDEASG